MRVIIAGSRNLEGRLADSLVAQAMESLASEGVFPSVILSGTARGIDRAGERWAEANGVPVTRYPANWDAYGKRAGPIRNSVMAAHADVLVAIWDGVSRGTRNMIDSMRAADKPVHVFTHAVPKPEGGPDD